MLKKIMIAVLLLMIITLIISFVYKKTQSQPITQTIEEDIPHNIDTSLQPHIEQITSSSIVVNHTLDIITSAALLSPEEQEALEMRMIVEARKLKGIYSGIVRPEEFGPDFTLLSNEQLLNKLNSKDKIEQRKAAIVIGDQFIAGKPFSDSEMKQIKNTVDRYLSATYNDIDNYAESLYNIYRLWHAAVPALLEALNNPQNIHQAEMASDALSVMRNEKIIQTLIEKWRNANGEKKKVLGFTLQKMKYPPHPVYVNNRSPISDESADELYRKLIHPIANDL